MLGAILVVGQAINCLNILQLFIRRNRSFHNTGIGSIINQISYLHSFI